MSQQLVADDAPATAEPKKVGPPILVILVGLVAVAASAALLFRHGIPAHMTGYLLATVVPIMAVGLFRRFDLARRASPFYVALPLLNQMIPLILVIGLLAGVLHTWSLATEFAS